MGSLRVTFQPEGKTAQAQTGESLLDIASREEIDISNLCGGQGVCGKCRVKISKGEANFTGKGISFLSKQELEDGYVLACQTKVLTEDVEVWIPPESRKEEEQILTVDHIVQYDEPVTMEQAPAKRSLHRQPLTQKFFLELPAPTLDDNLSDLDRIYRELRKKTLEPILRTQFSALHHLASILRDNNWKVTATLHLRDMD